MPKLTDIRKKIKVKLQSNPEVEIELYDGVLAADFAEIEKEGDDFKKALLLLVKLICDWNYTDDKDIKLPVTYDNVAKMEILDIKQLIGETRIGKSFLETPPVKK